MISKGKHQENMGKERCSHLSDLIPRNTERPTEATSSVDNPAYLSNTFRLLRLSRGEFGMFNFPLYLLRLDGLSGGGAIGDDSRHMTFPVEVGGRFYL